MLYISTTFGREQAGPNRCEEWSNRGRRIYDMAGYRVKSALGEVTLPPSKWRQGVVRVVRFSSQPKKQTIRLKNDTLKG